MFVKQSKTKTFKNQLKKKSHCDFLLFSKIHAGGEPREHWVGIWWETLTVAYQKDVWNRHTFFMFKCGVSES